MPRKQSPKKSSTIAAYEDTSQERLNNPPVGLVTPETDPDAGKKTYAYDPHLDPQLQWAGKAEHTSFEVPTVSLHVHERIDPRTIIEAVRKRANGKRQRAASAAVALRARQPKTRPCARPSSSTSTPTAGATAWSPATACW